MNCFEFRKLLLVQPRELTPEQENHALACPDCARAAVDAAALDKNRAQAVIVPVPDALAERLLLRQERRRTPHHFAGWALAATLVIGIAVGVHFGRAPEGGALESITPVAALPGDHAAVAALAYVLEHEPRLLEEGREGDPQVMAAAFRRAGLREPSGVSVRYLGKCPVAGGTGEHIVLTTPAGRATLILAPDHPLGPRVLIADGQRVALSSPAAAGSYIVVADSAETVRRVERLITL